MKALKLMIVLGMAGLASACADTDFATRTASIDPIRPLTPPVAEGNQLAIAADPAAAAPAMAPTRSPVQVLDLRVASVEVRVPRTLKVSEANRYYPKGDIVWREDPFGDRHAQVEAIFTDAMARGVTGIEGSRPVVLDVEVLRFHALTEKARYSVGGVHSLKFAWHLKDARTGQPLTNPKVVEADLKGYGGNQAIEAVMLGQTQKVRITDHLARVIREELTEPDGHRNAQLGFIQQLNKT